MRHVFFLNDLKLINLIGDILIILFINLQVIILIDKQLINFQKSIYSYFITIDYIPYLKNIFCPQFHDSFFSDNDIIKNCILIYKIIYQYINKLVK